MNYKNKYLKEKYKYYLHLKNKNGGSANSDLDLDSFLLINPFYDKCVNLIYPEESEVNFKFENIIPEEMKYNISQKKNITFAELKNIISIKNYFDEISLFIRNFKQRDYISFWDGLRGQQTNIWTYIITKKLIEVLYCILYILKYYIESYDNDDTDIKFYYNLINLIKESKDKNVEESKDKNVEESKDKNVEESKDKNVEESENEIEQIITSINDIRLDENVFELRDEYIKFKSDLPYKIMYYLVEQLVILIDIFEILYKTENFLIIINAVFLDVKPNPNLQYFKMLDHIFKTLKKFFKKYKFM